MWSPVDFWHALSINSIVWFGMGWYGLVWFGIPGCGYGLNKVKSQISLLFRMAGRLEVGAATMRAPEGQGHGWAWVGWDVVTCLVHRRVNGMGVLAE